MRNRAAALTLICALAVLIALPMLHNADPYATFVFDPRLPPSADHLLGTDALGRDVLVRLVAGALPTLAGSGVALAVALVGAALLGGIAAFGAMPFVRRVGDLVIESLLSMPSIVAAMVILTALDRTGISVAVAAGLSHIPLAAVVFRDQIQSTSGQLHVTAARSLGARRWRILVVHILPVSKPVLLAYSVTAFASCLLMITTLSFLGFAGDVASPEWGSMIADGRADVRSAPWVVAAPAIGIILAAAGLSVAARRLSRQR
ncbi:MAG: ABC transporter permease [Chloroflexi bacterium]|nr:ABC transporter permease [Chloroflexota bacterium]